MDNGFLEIKTRFLNFRYIRVLLQACSTALLHPFQHICNLQMKISKREFPTYNTTYTQQSAVSASFCQGSYKHCWWFLQIFVPIKLFGISEFAIHELKRFGPK